MTDVEWTARGGARTSADWKELFPANPGDEPTYAADVIGAMERFDERDCVFARHALRPGSADYTEYYRQHPELKPVDDELRAMPYFGHTERPEQAQMLNALFASMMLLTPEAVVQCQHIPVAGPGTMVSLSPEAAAAKVKGYARLLGADLVGIGPLRREFTYSHVGLTYAGQTWGTPIELDHPFAISLGIRMNVVGLNRTAPAFPTILESLSAYARGAWMAVQLAGYIASLGYRARAHHLLNYQVLSVPLAVDAGLGELSRCGFLVTQEFGNCLRLANVTTDLPLALDKPIDLGVQEFCESCATCAKACPVGAIPQGGKTEVRGVRKWALDAEKCYHYWHESGSDCGVCIATCPWSRWTFGPRVTEGEPLVPGGFYIPATRPFWLT